MNWKWLLQLLYGQRSFFVPHKVPSHQTMLLYTKFNWIIFMMAGPTCCPCSSSNRGAAITVHASYEWNSQHENRGKHNFEESKRGKQKRVTHTAVKCSMLERMALCLFQPAAERQRSCTPSVRPAWCTRCRGPAAAATCSTALATSGDWVGTATARASSRGAVARPTSATGHTSPASSSTPARVSSATRGPAWTCTTTASVVRYSARLGFAISASKIGTKTSPANEIKLETHLETTQSKILIKWICTSLKMFSVKFVFGISSHVCYSELK